MNMPDRRTRRQIPVAVLVLLATATLFMSSPSLAALRCPGAAEPAELTITPFFGKISYRMGNTRGDLKRIEQRHAGRGQGLPGNWFPLGLTLAQIGIRPSATFVIRTLRSGRICAFPQRVASTGRSNSLQELMNDINRHLSRDTQGGRFMTLFYLIVDQGVQAYRGDGPQADDITLVVIKKDPGACAV